MNSLLYLSVVHNVLQDFFKESIFADEIDTFDMKDSRGRRGRTPKHLLSLKKLCPPQRYGQAWICASWGLR